MAAEAYTLRRSAIRGRYSIRRPNDERPARSPHLECPILAHHAFRGGQLCSQKFPAGTPKPFQVLLHFSKTCHLPAGKNALQYFAHGCNEPCKPATLLCNAGLAPGAGRVVRGSFTYRRIKFISRVHILICNSGTGTAKFSTYGHTRVPSGYAGTHDTQQTGGKGHSPYLYARLVGACRHTRSTGCPGHYSGGNIISLPLAGVSIHIGYFNTRTLLPINYLAPPIEGKT